MHGPQRPRRQLPAEPWLEALLDEVGSPGWARACMYVHAGQAILNESSKEAGWVVTIQGLACVTPRNCSHNTGPLTDWHREASIQREYYSYPLDDYDLSIEECCNCAETGTIHFKVSRHSGSDGLARISWTHPLFVPHFGEAAGQPTLMRGGQKVSVSDVHMAWKCEGSPENAPMLLVPAPIGYLISKHRWLRLLLSISWHTSFNLSHGRGRSPGPLPSWPPFDAPAWEAVGKREEFMGDMEPMTPGAFANLASMIRKWSPMILAQAGSSEDTQQTLESTVLQLDR